MSLKSKSEQIDKSAKHVGTKNALRRGKRKAKRFRNRYIRNIRKNILKDIPTKWYCGWLY